MYSFPQIATNTRGALPIKAKRRRRNFSMNKPTRREFLAKTILGAVGSGVALSLFSPEDLAGQATKRGYTAGRIALDIGGVPAGWIESAEGGHATSDVVTEKAGVNVVRKNTGTVV